MVAKVSPGRLESHPSFWAASSPGRAPGSFSSGFQYPSYISVFLHLASIFSRSLSSLSLSPFLFILDSEHR